MKTISKKVELVCPARNMKAVKAALPNADSIYFGVKKFNMRMKSENFSIEEMKDVVKICHDNSIKAYLTTNILIYEQELGELNILLDAAKKAEIDAVIVHDFASIQAAKERGIPFHVSTQCNITNSIAAKSYESLGASKLILARECSLKQIKEIKSKIKAEIEIFVHGAMCSAVSGRCYLSQYCSGTEKSANRGRCEQPCRKEWRVFDEEGHEFLYDGVRFMNSRDLCMVTYIPEIIETGVDALKIEGRMRDPYYVHVVSSVYREAIDAYYNGTFSKKKAKNWRKELAKVYNRGMTTGFYFHRPTETDHQHKSATNLSHFRLIELGKILSCNKKTNLALVRLTNGYLKEGMPIVIMGGNYSDTFFTQNVKNLQKDGKKISYSDNADITHPIDLTLELSEPAQSGELDSIFYFTDKTYKSSMELRKKQKYSKKSIPKSEYYKLK
ncbi:MAG: peptidase U32 family protein [Candidatus Hodarchaeota archaeon]